MSVHDQLLGHLVRKDFCTFWEESAEDWLEFARDTRDSFLCRLPPDTVLDPHCTNIFTRFVTNMSTLLLLFFGQI